MKHRRSPMKSQISPERPDPEGSNSRVAALGTGDGRIRLRARLPLRGQAPAGLAGEVPVARWTAGEEDARAGVDRARASAGGVLHEAHRRDVASADARQGGRRNAAGHGEYRRGGGGRLRRVSALHRAGPLAEAVDTARLRLDLPQPRPATSRRPTAGGSDARPRRALGGDRDRPEPPDGQPDA